MAPLTGMSWVDSKFLGLEARLSAVARVCGKAIGRAH